MLGPFDRQITSKPRLQVPREAITKLDWNADVVAGANVTFELLEAGEARMLPGLVFERLKTEVAENFEILELILFKGKWETSGRLTLPREVVVHVLNDGGLDGQIFIFPTKSALYLWNNNRRLREILEVRSSFSEVLNSV